MVTHRDDVLVILQFGLLKLVECHVRNDARPVSIPDIPDSYLTDKIVSHWHKIGLCERFE
jgi:hypothetical protein